MTTLNIKVQYLFHSGFTVITQNNFLVFDFFKGDFKPVDLNTYVFVSHSHIDHFNPEIFKWQQETKNIKYILSSDIDPKYQKENVRYISAYQEMIIDSIKIKTYGSTDLGVSFLVEADNVRIFHAGDLNWWYWWGETPKEIAAAKKSFHEEIARIKGENIDIAFFPVDPRLEHNYYVGGEVFLREIRPRIFIPMHFGKNYQITREFTEKMIPCYNNVVTIEKKGQEFIY